VNSDTDPDAIATYADFYVMRTGLENGLLDKGKLPDIKGFDRAAAAAIDLHYSTLPYEAAQVFGNVYRDYLLWHNNRAELERAANFSRPALSLSSRSTRAWTGLSANPSPTLPT
jgi:hypothetical protein